MNRQTGGDSSFNSNLPNESLGDIRLSTSLREMRLETGRENIRTVFNFFDADEDGKLKFHELKYAIKALSFEVKNREVLELLYKYDPVNQRYIGFADFEREMLIRIDKQDPADEVKRAFKELAQGAESITLDSLRQYVQGIDYPTTESELKELFETFDLDDDGRISFREFLTTFDV